eukprot:9032119-Prorocentrum_lima.AAC.1
MCISAGKHISCVWAPENIDHRYCPLSATCARRWGVAHSGSSEPPPPSNRPAAALHPARLNSLGAV